ncbi:MAG: ECF-type sigma factor [Pseudomonadota bacterium]
MNRSALDEIYPEMKAIAQAHLRNWNRDALIDTTVIVHDAYLRLNGSHSLTDMDRAHALRLISRTIRHVLVDKAREARADKRGGGERAVTLPTQLLGEDGRDHLDLLVIEDLITRLSEVDDRLEAVVECRFFGGMTVSETAKAMDISERTVERLWTRVRAYLIVAMQTNA